MSNQLRQDESIESLRSALAGAQAAASMASKRADQYHGLYKSLAEKLPMPGGIFPSVSQVQNAAEKYVVMGVHFETLMAAIQKHETLQFKWEDLILLLKLTEGHEGDE